MFVLKTHKLFLLLMNFAFAFIDLSAIDNPSKLPEKLALLI